MNGPTKSSVLDRSSNSLGPIKYRMNTTFLSKHDVNVKRYWDNIVLISNNGVFAGNFDHRHNKCIFYSNEVRISRSLNTQIVSWALF